MTEQDLILELNLLDLKMHGIKQRLIELEEEYHRRQQELILLRRQQHPDA